MIDHCQTYVTPENLIIVVSIIVMINILTTVWFFAASRAVKRNEKILEEIDFIRGSYRKIYIDVHERQQEIAKAILSIK